MKLLFDQNLSFKLVDQLRDLFPGSYHLQDLNLDTAFDDEVWNYARKNDFIIITKDSDFNEFSIIRGTPPKIIWLQVGNCSTEQISNLLRKHYQDILAFESNDDEAIFSIS